jgi:hypothetical protein
MVIVMLFGDNSDLRRVMSTDWLFLWWWGCYFDDFIIENK